jgi:hypothetical protein
VNIDVFVRKYESMKVAFANATYLTPTIVQIWISCYSKRYMDRSRVSHTYLGGSSHYVSESISSVLGSVTIAVQVLSPWK